MYMQIAIMIKFCRIFHGAAVQLQAGLSLHVQEDLRHPLREELGRFHGLLQGPGVLLRERERGPGGGAEKVLQPSLPAHVHRSQLTVHLRPKVCY